MTDEQIEDLADAAVELLGESDAMDPKLATKAQSLEYLRTIEHWASTGAEALEQELGL